MKYVLMFFTILTCLSASRAQDRTRTHHQMNFDSEVAKVLLVPYEEKMFLSDVNREVNKLTGLELAEIKRIFREGLCQIVARESDGQTEVLDLLNFGDRGSQEDISYILHSVGYNFEEVKPLPVDVVEKTKTGKIIESITTKEEAEQQGRGAYTEEGEIKSWYDKKERFMNVQVYNDELIPFLVEKYECDYILFINQLDIKVMRDVNRDNGQTWARRIMIHFSLLDGEGKEVFSSAVYGHYGGDEKDIYQIIGKNFARPAQRLLSVIPSSSEESSQTEMEAKKPAKKEKTRTKVKSDNDDDF